MTNNDGTYCSIIENNCIGFKRKNCNECSAYSEAVKETYNKTINMINKKYGLKKTPYQEQLPL